METIPRFIVPSDGLEKPGIEPATPYKKVGYKWVYIHVTRTCYPDGSDGRAELDLSYMRLVRRLNPH